MASAIIIFTAGVFVGLEKARFSMRWDRNYAVNFGAVPPFGKFLITGSGFPGNFPGGMPTDRLFINAHGSEGQIIKLNNDVVTIEGQDGFEKNLEVNNGTIIKSGFTDLKPSDLQLNDRIVFFGAPDPDDNGQLLAKFIRVLMNIQ